VDELRHDAGLACPGISGDEQRTFFGLVAPKVDFFKQPFPSDELSTFMVELVGEIHGTQLGVPGAQRRFSLLRVVDALDDSFQPSLINGLGFPFHEVDIIEPANAEGRITWSNHRWDNGERGRPEATCVGEFV
jgi:hypothetical protein